MLKVVVIDSHALSRNLLTSVLVNGGYDVVGEASTNSSGVAAMVKLQPQLICIDLGQKEQAQLELLDSIRSGLPKALLFLVSSGIDPDMVQTAVQRGVRGFIVKPFNAATVLATIRNTIIKIAKQHQAA
jgi:DNA-binding NarL/FixJ family response regulator